MLADPNTARSFRNLGRELMPGHVEGSRAPANGGSSSDARRRKVAMNVERESDAKSRPVRDEMDSRHKSRASSRRSSSSRVGGDNDDDFQPRQARSKPSDKFTDRVKHRDERKASREQQQQPAQKERHIQQQQRAQRSFDAAVSAKQCSSCGGDSSCCGCPTNNPNKFVYANDGYIAETHFIYSSLAGWTLDVGGAPLFTLTSQDWGNVLVSPAVGQTIDTVAAQLGFDENTSIGDAVVLEGTGTQVFDTYYVVARLPTTANATYLLQPVNYLDCPCLAPIVGDYMQIRHGTSASVYEITAINLTDLSWVLADTGLESVVNAVPVRISCCE